MCGGGFQMVWYLFAIELSWGAELPLHRVQQERDARARLKRRGRRVPPLIFVETSLRLIVYL